MKIRDFLSAASISLGLAWKSDDGLTTRPTYIISSQVEQDSRPT